MNLSGIERQGTLMYQFNGMVEKEQAFGLELYETPFRSYDAQLGRFWQVEPLADEFHSISMFQFGFNNPISANDPSGLNPEDRNLEKFLLNFFHTSESGSGISRRDGACVIMSIPHHRETASHNAGSFLRAQAYRAAQTGLIRLGNNGYRAAVAFDAADITRIGGGTYSIGILQMWWYTENNLLN